jgi:hypothetical protein
MLLVIEVKKCFRTVFSIVDGPVRHLLAEDAHTPTPAQIKEEDDRHKELLKNPAARRAVQKQWDDDDKTMEELLRIHSRGLCV